MVLRPPSKDPTISVCERGTSNHGSGVLKIHSNRATDDLISFSTKIHPSILSLLSIDAKADEKYGDIMLSRVDWLSIMLWKVIDSFSNCYFFLFFSNFC